MNDDIIGSTLIDANHQTALTSEKYQNVYTERASRWVNPCPITTSEDNTALQTLEELRREYDHEVVWLIRWTDSTAKRRILRAIVEQWRGITYNTLEEKTEASYSTVKRRITELDNVGYVTATGNPRNVRIPTEEAYVLAADVASLPL